MSELSVIHERLSEIEGISVLQLEPYAVVSPTSIEATAGVLRMGLASDCRILPLGTGSSFSDEYSLGTRNVIAVLMSGLTGIEQHSAFSVKVMAGTPVSALINKSSSERVTIGGLLSDGFSPESFQMRTSLSGMLRSIDVLCCDGVVRTFFAEAGVSANRSYPAFAVLGSAGRIGIILSAVFRTPVPIQLDGSIHESRQERSLGGHREMCLSRSEIAKLFDPVTLFQW